MKKTYFEVELMLSWLVIINERYTAVYQNLTKSMIGSYGYKIK